MRVSRRLGPHRLAPTSGARAVTLDVTLARCAFVTLDRPSSSRVAASRRWRSGGSGRTPGFIRSGWRHREDWEGSTAPPAAA